eukprot:CAMPEP_0181332978 /NCGR_PEP_ID=MMETSP1101-20121128/25405_1 /TAXON_ID=46948 /ORGANISM="Rhodomonas abbreviata, Strain Caron Lab Isolate" /LENGTH=616 /DNA_ID=CAMNT_0023442705 /DNA_START=91 /DNA_END=1937 /DNA_ORIENTATION=-
MLPMRPLAVLYLSLCLSIWSGPLSGSVLGADASSSEEEKAGADRTIQSFNSLLKIIQQSPALHGPIAGVVFFIISFSAFAGWALAGLCTKRLVAAEKESNGKQEGAEANTLDREAMALAVLKEEEDRLVQRKASQGDRRKSTVEEEEAGVRSKFQESLSMAENVVELLQSLKQDLKDVLSVQQQAVISVTTKMLQNPDSHDLTVPLALSRGNLGSPSIPNLQVQEWLREAFTPRSTTQAGTKKSMKVVSKSIMFAVRLKKATSVSQTHTVVRDFVPFKVSSEQEEAIRNVLDGLDSWNFDIWRLSEVTGNRELEVVGWNVMHDWGLVKKFGIEVDTLKNWLAHVQTSYHRSNHFHNATHASDVLQTVHYILKTAKLSRYISEIEIFAILISATIHDMGHDGLSNNFHKNAVTDRALSFNDQSIQEMFHISSFFHAMQKDDSINLMKSLTQKQYLELRSIIIRVVLATDMSKHFQELKDFKQLMTEKGKSPDEWGEYTANLMSMVLHACDISGQCKDRAASQRWANKCHEEFFNQGDKEKDMDLPVSPLCDRTTTDVASSQVGFITFIVQPTWQVMADFFPVVAEEGFPQLKANLAYWEGQLPKNEQEEKAEKAEKG